MTMMTSRWAVTTYRFPDDKWWLILNNATLFVCPFFELLEMFPFCLKKTTTSFFTYLTLFSFFVFVRTKQVSLVIGFKQRKKQQLSLFVSTFFLLPQWWQLMTGGITNLVMTWWLGWVVVTKWSKCWWRMVPSSSFFFIFRKKIKFQFYSSQRPYYFLCQKNLSQRHRVSAKVLPTNMNPDHERHKYV